jgi:hypothetical protein
MSSRKTGQIAVIGIDIGKNSLYCWPRQAGRDHSAAEMVA